MSHVIIINLKLATSPRSETTQRGGGGGERDGGAWVGVEGGGGVLAMVITRPYLTRGS